jgi:signal peptidase I
MKSLKYLIKEWIIPLAITVALYILITTFVIETNKVPSGSMESTIHIGDRVISEKWIKPEHLKRGDIVTFHPPGVEELYIKRLIGLPGDVIEVKDHLLYINNKKTKEPYLKEPMDYNYGPVTVPATHYFFMGDNRNHSFDSHAWKDPFVSRERIVGKAVFRFFPFNRIGKLINPNA